VNRVFITVAQLQRNGTRSRGTNYAPISPKYCFIIDRVMTLADILKQLGVFVPTAAAVGAGVYWMLQKRLEAHLAQRLEVTKHELQLENQKRSIVFEHQKDAFRNVLVAMHRATEAIASGEGPDWYPISKSVVDTFRRVVSEESLFMDAESDHALALFVKAMWGAVEETVIDVEPDEEHIQRAYSQTTFILERLSDHFRARVGLSSVHSGSLIDVELLGACRLINVHHFHKYNLPTKGPLAFCDGQTASEVVAIAKQNLGPLRSELEQLKMAIRSDERGARLFFQVGTEVDRYLTNLRTSVVVPE
jgi:hypothetical protein